MTVLAGILLLAVAFLIDGDWLARHFPPDHRPPYQLIEDIARILQIVLAVAGVLLMFVVRPYLGSIFTRGCGVRLAVNIVLVLLAVGLALGASEAILRSTSWHTVQPVRMETEPLRQYDPLLGWTFKPARTGQRLKGGRTITYVFDAFGYRQPDNRTKTDFDRSTIIFAGESVMGGLGLTWAESIPTQVASMLHTQAANIAVRGYASDQSYLRLKTELPRFRRPVAVVMLFSPMLFRRNSEDGRPHLGPDLIWHPPVKRSKLATLIRRVIPYRSEEETRRGIVMTRTALRASVNLAHSRGAAAVILVPQYMPENPAERLIREQVLDNSDLPLVRVPLDPRWRVPGDWHPDARAAQAMAAAVAGYLRAHPSFSATSRP